PPCVERPVSLATAVQVPVIPVGTPSSTTIDQDAPSPSHSPSSSKLQPPISHQAKWCGQKTKAYSCGSCSDDADFFKGSDVSMGRSTTLDLVNLVKGHYFPKVNILPIGFH
nr:hypothetical protein [Tanacetum cinerariifolium]